ncbi:hypothetical protein PFISCL1PPCAC_21182, partial [Pristionchus fissidentatus]
SGTLRHVTRTDVVGVDDTCCTCYSNLFSTPHSSYFLIGCENGKVLLVQQKHSDASLDVTAIVEKGEGGVEETHIDEIAIFSGADISETDQFMVAMRMDFNMRVYAVCLSDGDSQSTTLIAEQQIDRDMSPYEDEDALYACELIGVGSLKGTHEIWLFNDNKVWRWRGTKGVWEKKPTVRKTGFGNTSTAVAVALKSTEGKEGDEDKNENGTVESARVDLVCMGTEEGRIGCWCIIEAGEGRPLETRRFEMNGIGAANRINELSIEVFDPLMRVGDDNLEFGIRLYILSDRRVSVSVLRVAITPTATKLRQVAVHHLLHFVQYPSQLAVESTHLLPSTDHNNNCCGGGGGPDATVGEVICRPQRIIVTGGSEFEVLLLCPRKLRCRESPLELVQEEKT